jgi:hypothetical protein
VKSVKARDAFFGRFLFSQIKIPSKTHSLFRHFQSTTYATVKQAKAKKASHDG